MTSISASPPYNSKNTDDISFDSLNFSMHVQVQFSHVTTCHSPAMSRRPAATAAAGGAGSSPVALPRSVAAVRGGAHLHAAARGSPHVRRKFAVNSTLNGGNNNNVSDYQVERCCLLRCFLPNDFLPRAF